MIIPLGSTGDAAAQIYAEINEEKEAYPYLEDYWSVLSSEDDVDKLVKAVISIAEKQRLN